MGSQPLLYQTGDLLLEGRYRIVREISHGGFGRVYRAEQLFCGVTVREVAIKVSHEAYISDGLAAERMRDPLVLTRVRVESPREGVRYLPEIYEMGKLPSGQVYAVLEKVPGRTLEFITKG